MRIPPYVDASPSVEDVYYQENGTAVFKTVLFSAEGNGGDTIFALDVTDPADPRFLWEYGDPALWRSKSSPPIGKIARLNTGAAQVGGLLRLRSDRSGSASRHFHG